MSNNSRQLRHPDGHLINVRHSPGNSPTWFFLPGFRSDMTGDKCRIIEKHALEKGYEFISLDYRGHGNSGGEFNTSGISDWLSDILFVHETYNIKNTLFIGSSMGAWLGILACLRTTSAIAGFIGIAPAPDFTHLFLLNRLSQHQTQLLQDNGEVAIETDYDDCFHLRQNFLKDASENRVMLADIAINCPVRLIHGQKDTSIDWTISIELAERLQSEDVQIQLIKNGDHRLSDPESIKIIKCHIDQLLS